MDTQARLAQIAAELRDIGPVIDIQRTPALYAPLHAADPAAVDIARDVPYGPDARHRLDVFTGSAGHGSEALLPLVAFVHGGGFRGGAKFTEGSPFYDNVGRWGAMHGCIGITVNYRLAPQFPFPAGSQDMQRLVQHLRHHARGYGGDPDRIFLWGHSAGAGHVARFVADSARPEIAGAILTSGIYDTTLEGVAARWGVYYGTDVALYPGMSSLPGLLRTVTPLLVTWAGLDRADFIIDSERLVAARAAAGRPLDHVLLPGHSHLSEIYGVGTADTSLTGPVLQFIQRTGKSS
ncbi:MAG: alpha/beta hydrolase [Steroidobacteraceae bacterium]